MKRLSTYCYIACDKFYQTWIQHLLTAANRHGDAIRKPVRSQMVRMQVRHLLLLLAVRWQVQECRHQVLLPMLSARQLVRWQTVPPVRLQRLIRV